MASFTAPGQMLGKRYQLTTEFPDQLPYEDVDVWNAVDTMLGNTVRVIAINPSSPVSGDALDAARRSSLIDDPHVVRILSVGEEDEAYYVVTEVPLGNTLSSHIHGIPFPAEQAHAIVGEVASALNSARVRGVRHLQIDASFVRVGSSGEVFIDGLGIAAALAGIHSDSLMGAETDRLEAHGLCLLLAQLLTGAPRAEDSLLNAIAHNESISPVVREVCVREIAGVGPLSPSDMVRELAPWGGVTPAVFPAPSVLSQSELPRSNNSQGESSSFGSEKLFVDAASSTMNIAANDEDFSSHSSAEAMSHAVAAGHEIDPLSDEALTPGGFHPRWASLEEFAEEHPEQIDPSATAIFQVEELEAEIEARQVSGGNDVADSSELADGSDVDSFEDTDRSKDATDHSSETLPTGEDAAAGEDVAAGSSGEYPAGKDESLSSSLNEVPETSSFATEIVEDTGVLKEATENSSPENSQQTEVIHPVQTEEKVETVATVAIADGPSARIDGSATENSDIDDADFSQGKDINKGDLSEGSSSSEAKGRKEGNFTIENFAQEPDVSPLDSIPSPRVSVPVAPLPPERVPASSNPGFVEGNSVSFSHSTAPHTASTHPTPTTHARPAPSIPESELAGEVVSAKKYNSSKVVVIGAVVALVLMGVWAVSTLFSPTSVPDIKSSQPSATTEAPSSEQKQNTPAENISGLPSPTISEVKILNPYGSGLSQPVAQQDNPRMIPFLTDGKPDTYWQTWYYPDASFAGTKKGVGLAIKLSERSKITSVTVDSPASGGTVQWRKSSVDSPDSGEVLAEATLGGSTTLKAPKVQAGDTVILWFPQLSSVEGTYRIRISNIAVN